MNDINIVDELKEYINRMCVTEDKEYEKKVNLLYRKNI